MKAVRLVMLVATSVWVAAVPSTARAWGAAGHRIVAEIAEQQIHAGTRAELQRLLTVFGARSMAEIANWADDIRSDSRQRERGRATAPLHFVNFPDARCQFDSSRICRNGQCIVAAIDRHAQILGDRARGDLERAESLAFLVHFVADIHQPLHAGYRPDRGGNAHQVRFNGEGPHLHAIWDSKIVASRVLGWSSYARRLGQTGVTVAGGTPADWAEQSCRLTRDDSIYPTGRTIDDAYLTRMRPVAELQLRRAGARLAALLNDTLKD
jgi:hypothetical protein